MTTREEYDRQIAELQAKRDAVTREQAITEILGTTAVLIGACVIAFVTSIMFGE